MHAIWSLWEALLQLERKDSNRKLVTDDLARAMDAHLQSTGLRPEGRVEKELPQQFVQMVHRPAYDVQWPFAILEHKEAKG